MMNDAPAAPESVDTDTEEVDDSDWNFDDIGGLKKRKRRSLTEVCMRDAKKCRI